MPCFYIQISNTDQVKQMDNLVLWILCESKFYIDSLSSLMCKEK